MAPGAPPRHAHERKIEALTPRGARARMWDRIARARVEGWRAQYAGVMQRLGVNEESEGLCRNARLLTSFVEPGV